MIETTLENLRTGLSRGPEQKSALDRIVEGLVDATNSGLHAKLMDWGWINEHGRSMTWADWHTFQYQK